MTFHASSPEEVKRLIEKINTDRRIIFEPDIARTEPILASDYLNGKVDGETIRLTGDVSLSYLSARFIGRIRRGKVRIYLYSNIMEENAIPSNTSRILNSMREVFNKMRDFNPKILVRLSID
jgi:hypothetical protein